MSCTVNYNGLTCRVIGSWWHWEQGHLVSAVWAIRLLLGLSIRESEELGRWVKRTDCLQMAAVEGSTSVPVKNPLLFPMGEGSDRQRGGPGPWRVHQMCVWGQQQAFGGREMQVDAQSKGIDLLYQLCWIYYTHKLEYKVYFSFYV